LKPKATVSPAEIAMALEHVRALQGTIDGIVEVEAGENRNGSNQGYTYGFVIRFANAEIYQLYSPHPAHQPVSQELLTICENIIDFDIGQ
jgi:hypothetical protein